MPEIRFAFVVPRKIARRLAAGGADLAQRPEIIPELLFQQLSGFAHKVGGNLICGFHCLCRTSQIEDHAGRVAVFVKSEQQINAGIFAAFHSGKIFAVSASVHFRSTISINRAPAMPDSGKTQSIGDTARLTVTPGFDDYGFQFAQ